MVVVGASVVVVVVGATVVLVVGATVDVVVGATVEVVVPCGAVVVVLLGTCGLGAQAASEAQSPTAAAAAIPRMVVVRRTVISCWFVIGWVGTRRLRAARPGT